MHTSPTTILAWDSPPRMDRSREGLRRRSGADLGDELGDRLGRRGRIADEADQPHQGDQGRKQGQQPVVGQSRRPIAQVVSLNSVPVRFRVAKATSPGPFRPDDSRAARRLDCPNRWCSQPELSGAADQFAWVHAELAEQISVLLRVNLVRQLLAGLLRVVVIAAVAQHLQDLFLGDLHDLLLVLSV